MLHSILWTLLPLVSGWLFGSFSVYWIHRLMHEGKVFAKRHIEHHIANAGQGWWGEFMDYIKPGWPVIAVTALPWLFHSVLTAIIWSTAVLINIMFNAFTHEVSHTNPSLAFWLSKPVHYFHHKNQQWRHNFGFDTVLWDKLFGTFKDDTEWQKGPYKMKELLQVKA